MCKFFLSRTCFWSASHSQVRHRSKTCERSGSLKLLTTFPTPPLSSWVRSIFNSLLLFLISVEGEVFWTVLFTLPCLIVGEIFYKIWIFWVQFWIFEAKWIKIMFWANSVCSFIHNWSCKQFYTHFTYPNA